MLYNNSSLVGHIKSSRMPYYDNKSRTIKFKARPVLILKAEKISGDSDFTVLPVSKISFTTNIDSKFDVPVMKAVYPDLNLNEPTSYIRCGKIMTIHKKDLATATICDLKGNYPALWQQIVELTKEYVSDVN